MAVKTIVELQADLPAIAAKLNKTIADAQRYAALSIYAEIISGNPVDTGFSRANWNISLNSPDFSTSGPRNPKGSYAPQPVNIPANENLEPIFIANGVDYVQFLEEGHSQQAPNGFIRLAVEKVKAELDAFLANQTS